MWRVIQSYVLMLSDAKWKISLGVFTVVILLCCMFLSLAWILIGLKEGFNPHPPPPGPPPSQGARWSLNNLFWGSFLFYVSSQIFVNAFILDQSFVVAGSM